MKKLLQFYADFGRSGDLSGRFVLDDSEQFELESLYGKEVYFGEVLGKHSEVTLVLKPEHITVVTDDQGFLSKATELGISLGHGHNPLEYWRDQSR